MPKFYGKIGYVETIETEPGIWEEQTTVKYCYGDLTRRYSRRWSSADNTTNSNVSISNDVSIIMDPYTKTHMGHIRWVEWNGVKWKVEELDGSELPRLHLKLGGEYNENTP